MSTPYVSKIQEIANGSEVQIYANDISGSTWTNEAKNDHHLTIYGAVTNTTGGPGDSLTHYLSFDGVDDYAETAHDSELNFSGTGTHGVWVYLDGGFGGTDSWGCVFSKGSGNYEFRRNSDISQWWWSPDAGYGASYSNPPTSEWVFYVIVQDDSTDGTIWKCSSGDTAPVEKGDVTYNYGSSTAPFALGHRSDSSRYFDGWITGYFSISGVLLTTTNIWDIYQAAFESPTTDLGSPNGLIVVSSVSVPTISTTIVTNLDPDDLAVDSDVADSVANLGPVEPANFTFEAHSNLVQLDGSWDADPEAHMYNVEVDEETAPSTWATFKHFNTIGTAFQHTDSDGVTSNTNYRSRVRSEAIRAYEQVVMNDSPVNYWRFLETSGSTTSEETGTVADGTVYGANLDVSGIDGPGISFDGVDDYVNVGGSTVTTDTFTWEFWIYRVSTNVDQMFFGGISSGTYFRYYNGKLHGSLHCSDGQKTLSGIIPINTEQWHHVVARFDGTTFEFFVDGKFDRARTEDLSAYTVTNWNVADLGRWIQSSPRWFGGRFAEVAIYDYAFTDNQIFTHYAAGSFLLYTEEVLADSPVLYIPANGSTEDVITGRSMSNLSTAPTFGDGAVAQGVTNSHGVNFDGTVITGSTLTVEIWHRDVGVTSYGSLFCSSTNNHHMILASGSRDLCMFVDTGTAVAAGTSLRGNTPIIKDGKWHHYVNVITTATTGVSGTVKQYVDGEYIGEDTHGMDITTYGVSRVGNWGSNYASNDWDEAAVYDYALSEDRIRAHYRAGCV